MEVLVRKREAKNWEIQCTGFQYHRHTPARSIQPSPESELWSHENHKETKTRRICELEDFLIEIENFQTELEHPETAFEANSYSKREIKQDQPNNDPPSHKHSFGMLRWSRTGLAVS